MISQKLMKENFKEISKEPRGGTTKSDYGEDPRFIWRKREERGHFRVMT